MPEEDISPGNPGDADAKRPSAAGNGRLADGKSPGAARAGDTRIYVPEHQGWTAAIKHGWTKEYCFLQNPGEDFYHLLVSGEIYLQRGTEKYCLSCSLRHGFATRERSYWQKEAGGTIAVSSEPTPDE
jgi:hypothetical protein